MAKLRKIRKIASLPDDPTIPEVSIEIDEKKYRLCFDFAALAKAKSKLREHGVEVNLLQSLDFRIIDVDTLPVLFYAASQHFQPNLTWEEAVRLVNVRTALGIFEGLGAAYMAAMVKPDKNPPLAPQS